MLVFIISFNYLNNYCRNHHKMPRRRIETRAERQDASAGCGIILRQIRSVTNDCVRLFKTDALTERTKQYCICRYVTSNQRFSILEVALPI